MQCCNKADYNIDFEICCDYNSSRPAPFLHNTLETDLHKSRFYVRSAESRTTKTRVTAPDPAYRSSHTGNFGPETPLTFNHWEDMTTEWIQRDNGVGHYNFTKCAPQPVKPYESHYRDSSQVYC
jgi:hypothetical protein